VICMLRSHETDKPSRTLTYLLRERPNVLVICHAHEGGGVVDGHHLERAGGPCELEEGEARDEGRGTLCQGHDYRHQEESLSLGLSSARHAACCSPVCVEVCGGVRLVSVLGFSRRQAGSQAGQRLGKQSRDWTLAGLAWTRTPSSAKTRRR